MTLEERVSRLRERWNIPVSRHVPLKVTFSLASPLVVERYPLTLDSLLTYAVAVRVRNDVVPAPRDLPKELIDLPLPLRRTGSVWHGSVMIPEGASEAGMDFYNKKWHGQPPNGLTKTEFRLVLAQGPLRNVLNDVMTLDVPTLAFYACGLEDEVRGLVQGIHSLGAHRAKGYGWVTKVRVERMHTDYSLWRNGVPMRPIPITEVPDYRRHYYGPAAFKPPHWYVAHQALCVLPFPEVWLGLTSIHSPEAIPDPDEATSVTGVRRRKLTQ